MREFYNLAPDSLARQLLLSAQVIGRVNDGTALPQAINDVLANHPDANRGAIQDLSFRVVRQRACCEALIRLMCDKAPKPTLLQNLICCALALMTNDENNAPYSEFTVVDQAVFAAAAEPRIAHAKSMVNAVLRRFQRERDELLRQARKAPAAQWNYPSWWINKCQSDYPEQWQSILSAGNLNPPLTLRVNRRKTTVTKYLETLSSQGITATEVGPFAVRLAKPVPVSQIPGFEQGWVSVQDAAAQLAAPLLDLQDGMRVLDACAAPGGKTGHLLEMADIDLLALDIDPQRVKRIDENLQRLQLTATIKTGNAAVADWWDGQGFDRVLADVPCTASGIVRRHPDIRWLRRKADSVQLATLSTRILDNLWMMTKPNGKLLLVTCSIWPEESERQAREFARRHQAKRLMAPGQLLPIANDNNDHDGLFFALFEKPGETVLN